MQLRGNYQTDDLRLDRIPNFDPRSRNYPIRAVVSQTLKEGRTWPCPTRLDQGSEGACTGFSRALELRAIPSVIYEAATTTFARQIYHAAQKIDEWPGESYEGSSVLAATKIAQQMGYVTEYRWAFSVDEALAGCANGGPVIFGTDWLEGMFSPRPSGLLEVKGNVSGGHAYLARGVLLKPRLRGEANNEPVFRVLNSWGAGWGVGGEAYIRASDMEHLLKGVSYAGECCLTTGRARP